MATPFLADNLVKLPRFTVPEMLALMAQVEAEAGAIVAEREAAQRPLPDFVKKALSRISQARVGLEEAVQQRDVSEGTSAAQRQSDRKMDDAWKAFEAFVKAWSMLDDGATPGQAEAHKLYDLVIGDGMGFITLPFELEWQETKKRLEIIDRQGLAPLIEQLGGERFLAHLRQCFEEYGAVLQLSPRPADTSALRAQWEAAYGAVRHYFAKLVALEDPEEPQTQVMVRRLLRPIVEWQQRANQRAVQARRVSLEEATELATTQRLRVIKEKE